MTPLQETRLRELAADAGVGIDDLLIQAARRGRIMSPISATAHLSKAWDRGFRTVASLSTAEAGRLIRAITDELGGARSMMDGDGQ